MAGSTTNTYNTVALGPGSVALKTRQPAACARTAGSVDCASASLKRPRTTSKSTARSGRTALNIKPAFEVNDRGRIGATGTGGRIAVGTGGAPGAGAWGAGGAGWVTGGPGCCVVGVTG